MPSSVKGFNVKIGAETSGLQEALKGINKISKNLNSELRYINKYLKLDSSNTLLEAEKMNDLKKQIENTKNAIKALEEARESLINKQYAGEKLNEKEAEQLRSINIELEAQKTKIKELEVQASSWTKLSQKAEEFGNTVQDIGNKLNTLGNTLTTTLTIPIATAAVASVNAAKEFESAFTGVMKTVEGTEEQLNTIKQGIKEMSEQLPATTTEISAVAEAAGQLGIATEDVLSFTKVMIDLGESTNLSAEDAATAFAKIANITGTASSDYSRLGSTLVDLGNNFATTESDIVNMTTRLAATGDLAGLSVSQIMALATAMSSVGIEAEAGGSAMSKLLKKIQTAVETGSGDLKDYAKVANMTTSQFKKAFKDNAVGALSSFISGLNDTKRIGKSAIVVLDDMDLKEVRLSNTILSLANSNNLLTDAVKTAENAWKDNTALTTEAEKRYATFESQLAMTKNQLSNLAVEFGEEMIPYLQDALKWIGEMIDKFDSLSDEEKETVIRTAAVIASIGPMIKVFSLLTTGTGKAITSFAGFSKEFAKAKNGLDVANTATGLFAKSLATLLTPTGLAITAVTALAAAFTYFEINRFKATFETFNELKDTLNTQVKSWDSLKEARENALSDASVEIVRVQNLRKELSSLTDENGKVKSGYEQRVQYIINELNSALGTEIQMNDNVISKYQEVQTELDKLINKKKAEALLTAYTNEYAEALKNQADATKNLSDLFSEYKKTQQESFTATGKEAKEAQIKMEALNGKIAEQTDLVSQYGYTIQNYESLQAAYMSGNAEEIEKATQQMQISWKSVKDSVGESLSQQIIDQDNYLTNLRGFYATAQKEHNDSLASILSIQIEKNTEKYNNLVNSFVEETKAVQTLGDEQKEAYRIISENNIAQYNSAYEQMGSGVREQLDKVARIVSENTTIKVAHQNLTTETNRFWETSLAKQQQAEGENLQKIARLIETDTNIEIQTQFLGEKGVVAFNQEMSKMQDDTRMNLETVKQVIIDDTGVEEQSAQLGADASSEFSSKSDAWGTGNNYTIGLAQGIEAGSGQVYSAVRNLGERMKAEIMASLQEHSPSKFTKEVGINFDLGLINGILDSKKYVLSTIGDLGKESGKALNNSLNTDVNKITGNLTSNVIDKSKTIFTTPNITFNVQEMNEQNLKKCLDYLNRRLGSAY